jgi:putative phosphoesterase
MRLALISDIHGNACALDAVAADIQREGVEHLVCLGDVASGPQPRQCIARVRELGCPAVAGNADEELITGDLESLADQPDHDKLTDLVSWAADQLTEGDVATLRSYQPTVSFSLGEVKLLCYHGSPRSNHEAVAMSTPEEALAKIFVATDAVLLVGGHTHVQMLRRWRDRLIINPGSIGLPFYLDSSGREHNPAFAEWAMVTAERGRLSVDFRRTPFDLEQWRHEVLDSGMPHAQWYVQGWEYENEHHD